MHLGRSTNPPIIVSPISERGPKNIIQKPGVVAIEEKPKNNIVFPFLMTITIFLMLRK
jgi:hypothetical protein